MTDPAHVADLEASGRAALPALEEHAVGGWLIRVSGGETKRVNSANPVAPGAHPAEALAAAARLYDAHDLPRRFRLTPLAHPDADAALAALGYAAIDHSLVMTGPVAAVPPDPAVRLTCSAAEHLMTVKALAPRADAEVHARVLAGIPGPVAFAVLDDGDGPLAAGMASIGGGRAQLADILVAPAARGRGLGRRLVGALLGWAAREGCAEAILQVLADNAPARRLYRSIGFVDAFAYHYRVG